MICTYMLRFQSPFWVHHSKSPYKDKKRDIPSNIALCLREFPRAKPEGTAEGKGPLVFQAGRAENVSLS